MRKSMFSVVLLVLATSAAYADKKERSLTVDEVQAQVQPYLGQVEKCYVDAARDIRGAGHLDLAITIRWDGTVAQISSDTPGVPAKVWKQIDTCVRATLDTVRFPQRRADTTAVVPYFFQHTWAPNSGPQESCWSPKGCWPNTSIGRENPEPKAAIRGGATTASRDRARH
jgi:hypothetical protein